jgi:hypothetical protein
MKENLKDPVVIASIIGGIFALTVALITTGFQESSSVEKQSNAGDREEYTCWEGLVTEDGNVSTLCVGSGKIKIKHIYNNATIEDLPTICRGIGSITREKTKWKIDIEYGTCDNGQGFAGSLECGEPDSTSLTCFSEGERTIYKKLDYVKTI